MEGHTHAHSLSRLDVLSITLKCFTDRTFDVTNAVMDSLNKMTERMLRPSCGIKMREFVMPLPSL